MITRRSVRTLRVLIPSPDGQQMQSYADVDIVAGDGVTLVTSVAHGRATLTISASGDGSIAESILNEFGQKPLYPVNLLGPPQPPRDPNAPPTVIRYIGRR